MKYLIVLLLALTLSSYSAVGMDGGDLLFLGTGNDGDNAVFSIIVGNWNSVTGSNSLVVGENNWLGAGGATLLGEGLVCENFYSPMQIIVGEYNDPLWGSDQLFVVGNGTSAEPEDRSNALEVYADGTVRIPKRQGDVGMGRFTSVTADQ